LAESVLRSGFVKEEVNHAVVAVEETPPDEIKKSKGVYVSGVAYNQNQCEKDDLLSGCFQSPHDVVLALLLSHNHMMLIMRAFATAAKWDLPPIPEKGVVFCDDEGKLSLAAVAESENGKPLAELVEEGLDVEVLSWKMDVEEPDAASIISNALNMGNELALRTTEQTAISVLKGEIIYQATYNAQQVAFSTVQEKVRAQLEVAVDDPDLIQIFDFLINAGVGKNTYIDDLLQFCTIFVNSKFRQLRFAAFEPANKMPQGAILGKMGVIKRAYRMKPRNGFCPGPEPAWGDFAWTELEKLEALLRFFHSTCKPYLLKLGPQSRTEILANIDVAACDAFFDTCKAKKKTTPQKIQDALIASVEKYAEQLGLAAADCKSPEKETAWINFSKPAETPIAVPHTVNGSETLLIAPAVILFDEITGAQLNQQLEFGVPKKDTLAGADKAIVPWRIWLQHHGESLGAVEADKAAAVAGLHALHEKFDVASQQIEVFQTDKIPFMVFATAKVEPNTIWLPPCVPKQSKVYDKSEHPHAIAIQQRVVVSTEASITAGDVTVKRERTWYVTPEFKKPKLRDERNAAACASTTGDDAALASLARTDGVGGDAAVADDWEWGENGEETMHPFWAVRRMTPKQLAIAKTQKIPIGQLKPRFNCKLEMQEQSVVVVGHLGHKHTNRTRVMEVPFVTNYESLEIDEELIIEITEPIKKPSKVKKWQELVIEQQKDQKKEKAAKTNEAKSLTKN